MKLRMVPSRARGTISAPPSKSMAHRALILASLARGKSVIAPVADSQDMRATISVLSALGASFERDGAQITVTGVKKPFVTGEPAHAGESGSTLRFLIPLILTLDEKVTLSCAPRLLERPLGYYETLCRNKGFLFEKSEGTLTLKGRLTAGDYTVPGDVSSQYITGMLFALATLPQESTLTVTGELQSASYLELTLSALQDFGGRVRREGHCFLISPAELSPRDYTVEGDYSNAAFLEGFRLLGDEVSVTGLREDSLQGDRVYRDFYPVLREKKAEFDLRDCPDLAPVCFALSALFHGGVFHGIERLALKESDRGRAMAEELGKCGIRVALSPHSIEVFAGGLHAPDEPVQSHNDHRIAMAMSLVLSRVGGEIWGAEAVAKSYPEYFDVLQKLGIIWYQL